MTILPAGLLQHTIWNEDKNPIWLGTSLSIARNLARYKFPSKLTEEEMKGCCKTLTSLFKKSETFPSPLFLPAENLPALDKEFLFEHFLCLESFQNMAAGQGFFIDDQRPLLCLVNLKNHLHFQLMDASGDLLTAWSELMKIEHAIGAQIPFAFSPKFGYLTADPTQCGTALQALLFLHVPALHQTGKLHETLKKHFDEGVSFFGLEGSDHEWIGDFLILKNRYCLGIKEEAVLHSLQTYAASVVASEKALRLHLKETGNATLKDVVSRAYGLLLHSYQLHTKEALNALSVLKLGWSLGWIKGLSGQKIDNLFFSCRHAHLAHLLNATSLDPVLLAHQRATYIQREIQGVVLHE